MRKLFAIIAALCFMTLIVQAQTEPALVSEAEYDIGVNCPLTQALSPDAETVWVLMSGCFGEPALEAFRVADGAPVPAPADFSGILNILDDQLLIPYQTSMVFTDDQTISLYYVDSETYQMRNLRFTLDGAPVEPLIADDNLAELLDGYSEFHETAVFNADHTQVAITGSTQLTVLDLAAGAEIFSLPVEPETYNAFPAFSPDGQTLYIAAFDDINDFSNNAATLSAYQLADGTLLNSTAITSTLVWISPDNHYAAIQNDSNDGTWSNLSIVDLETGSISSAFDLYEGPRAATICTNDGRAMEGITVSGRLNLAAVTWLPDSRTFIGTRSYNAEGIGGGRPCTINTSRLNRFSIAD